jgi:hypothetical protein
MPLSLSSKALLRISLLLNGIFGVYMLVAPTYTSDSYYAKYKAAKADAAELQFKLDRAIEIGEKALNNADRAVDVAAQCRLMEGR